MPKVLADAPGGIVIQDGHPIIVPTTASATTEQCCCCNEMIPHCLEGVMLEINTSGKSVATNAPIWAMKSMFFEAAQNCDVGAGFVRSTSQVCYQQAWDATGTSGTYTFGSLDYRRNHFEIPIPREALWCCPDDQVMFRACMTFCRSGFDKAGNARDPFSELNALEVGAGTLMFYYLTTCSITGIVSRLCCFAPMINITAGADWDVDPGGTFARYNGGNIPATVSETTEICLEFARPKCRPTCWQCLEPCKSYELPGLEEWSKCDWNEATYSPEQWPSHPASTANGALGTVCMEPAPDDCMSEEVGCGEWNAPETAGCMGCDCWKDLSCPADCRCDGTCPTGGALGVTEEKYTDSSTLDPLNGSIVIQFLKGLGYDPVTGDARSQIVWFCVDENCNVVHSLAYRPPNLTDGPGFRYLICLLDEIPNGNVAAVVLDVEVRLAVITEEPDFCKTFNVAWQHQFTNGGAGHQVDLTVTCVDTGEQEEGTAARTDMTSSSGDPFNPIFTGLSLVAHDTCYIGNPYARNYVPSDPPFTSQQALALPICVI